MGDFIDIEDPLYNAEQVQFKIWLNLVNISGTGFAASEVSMGTIWAIEPILKSLSGNERLEIVACLSDLVDELRATEPEEIDHDNLTKRALFFNEEK
ncbi:MAG: hypothetical protein CMM42_04525 [Rhodospirillaceae bacterium]|nr:hypothetical protein [Rhodospirillaceae bacterium]|tara:strand:+ start:88 stop:378 length:291 start_codon:yes stop_codon:yes gene_type:complete